MKTGVNIPWNAQVERAFSPQEQAPKRLPLVVARMFESRSSFDVGELRSFIHLLENLPSGDSLSIAHSFDSATRVESILYRDEACAVAMLTSDGKSSIVLQAISSSWADYDTHDPALSVDALIRAFVLRYARLDADARAFVLPRPDEPSTEHPMHFIRPLNWGFRLTATDTHAWTANRLDQAHPSTVKNTYCTKNKVLVSPYRSPFDATSTPDRGDPLQCLPPLRHVRATLERRFCSTTHPCHAEELCYWPALALGRCRLFGAKVDDASDFTLGSTAFMHASRWLMQRIFVVLRWAEKSQHGRSAYTDQNLALELLEARMDAHATFLALDEAYAAATYECEPTAQTMGRRLNQVRRVINLFDGNLQKQLPLLRLAASTFLLENWRRLLAPPYRDLPPWWLDGCLEQ